MRKRLLIVITTIIVAAFGCKREKPDSCFTTSMDQATINDSITFDLSCSENASYITWDWGDGTTVNNRDLTTTHSYGTPGQYTVTLTVCEHAMWYKSETTCDSYSKAIIVTQ